VSLRPSQRSRNVLQGRRGRCTFPHSSLPPSLQVGLSFIFSALVKLSNNLQIQREEREKAEQEEDEEAEEDSDGEDENFTVGDQEDVPDDLDDLKILAEKVQEYSSLGLNGDDDDDDDDFEFDDNGDEEMAAISDVDEVVFFTQSLKAASAREPEVYQQILQTAAQEDILAMQALDVLATTRLQQKAQQNQIQTQTQS